MKSTSIATSTTATLLIPADNKHRVIYLHPNAATYVGNSSVTNTTGFHCLVNTPIAIEVPAGETLYGILATGTGTCLTLTPDVD
jgi:hypothetical protein